MKVASEVRRAVELDAALGKMLGQGLVNFRATARHLQAAGVVPAGQSDAVVSALRRIRRDGRDWFGRAGDLLGQAQIDVTAPVASITIRHALQDDGQQPMELNAELLAMLAPRWHVHSPQGVRLVVPERRLEGAEARILAVPEIQIRRGLAEVAVVLAPDARRVLGILAVACQRLALDGVNIVETVDGFGQHTFLVAQEQAEIAVQALKQRRPARSNESLPI